MAAGAARERGSPALDSLLILLIQWLLRRASMLIARRFRCE
jgi:hypothetical protein